MPSHPLVDDIRRFVLSFGKHDADCPSIDATAWEQQTALCVCGFAPRLNAAAVRPDAPVTMTSPFLTYINSGAEVLPDSIYGDGYRCSVHLKDGTYLPCVILRRAAPVMALATRRLDEEKKGKGIFRGGDGYERTLKAFVASGNRVDGNDVARVESSKFAIPRDLLDRIQGETSMSWTGFVLEMQDGKAFSYGTTFAFEFFDLPEGYEFSDVATVHNHSYVSESGAVESLRGNVSAPLKGYDRNSVLREKPFFICYFDA